MHRKRLTMVLVIFAVSAVGLSALIGTAAAQVKSHSTARAAKVTTITVTAGKPSEFAFKLSKTSLLPAGKITFKVTNAGVIGHSFKVCTKAVTASTANACVGTATKVLNKGQSATLTVTSRRTRHVRVPLHRLRSRGSGGMKGLMGAVGVRRWLTTKGAKPGRLGGSDLGPGAGGQVADDRVEPRVRDAGRRRPSP